jgi:hypothetical protein
MAYCLIIENLDESQEQFEAVGAYLRASGPVPADGQRLMIAGPADQGWRLVTVWDSLEAFDRFRDERLAAAVREVGCPMDNVAMTAFEVHTLVAGDLIGTPQPA